MSLPITYSESTDSNGVDGAGSTFLYVYRSRQSRPYNRATEYIKKQGYTVAADCSAPFTGFGNDANVAQEKGSGGWSPDTDQLFLTAINRAVNSVYSKFADKVKGASAMVAVNVAERNQALGMIESRAKQLLRFCNALRRRHFKEAAALLGMKAKPFRKSLKNDFAGQFLEYHFGWEPLIADIHGAIDILQGSVPDKHVLARGKREYSRFYSRVDTGQRINILDVLANAQASASCRVVVTNPSLHQADQAGLVNPAAVAWELVPFSFVVDWFIPVGTFLNSMTDFLGLQLDDASYFTILRTPVWLNSIQYYLEPYGHRHIVTTGFIARRHLGVPSVTLVPNRIYGISPIRAATAISLLLQQGLRG